MVSVRRAILSLLATPIALGGQTATDHYRAGRAAYGVKPGEAVKEFEKAVAMDDRNAEYHLWLGNALGTVAQNASVLRQPFLAKRIKSEFERTVQLDPSNVGGREGLMQFYLQAPGVMGGSVAKAREQAEAIAKVSPLRGHFARATIASREKDQATVEREDRAAVAEFPDSLVAVNTLVNLFLRTDRADEAFATLDQFLARRPGDPGALMSLGRVAALTGRQLDRGEEALRRALAAVEAGAAPNGPAPATIHYRLGDVFAKKGSKDQARR